MNDKQKEILRYALILFIITAVVSAMLAGVNIITKDKILANENLQKTTALQAVMKGADTFEITAGANADIGDGIKKIYAARKDGKDIGFCIEMSADGYGGKIELVVGVALTGEVSGISIISDKETPGLGANIKGSKFKDQFIGTRPTADDPLKVVKGTAAQGQVSAVSGATISSKAVAQAVTKALSYLSEKGPYDSQPGDGAIDDSVINDGTLPDGDADAPLDGDSAIIAPSDEYLDDPQSNGATTQNNGGGTGE